MKLRFLKIDPTKPKKDRVQQQIVDDSDKEAIENLIKEGYFEAFGSISQ